MKKNFIRFFISIIAICISALYVSCYAPSPLYGTWQDSYGNKITFMPDSTYTSTVTLNGNKEQQDGSYEVLNNVLVFTRSSGSIMSTEWDIRGNIMYLAWTDTSSNSMLLTLMKISN